MWQFLVFLMYCGGGASQAGSSSNQTGHEIITSQRGRMVLLRAGYRYYKDLQNKNGSSNWRCAKRTVCKARLYIGSDNSIIREDNHNCVPDPASNELEINFAKCMQKVKEDYTIPIPNAFRHTVSTLKDKGINLIQKIPKFRNVKNKFYRNRNKSLGAKKLCFKSLSEVIVPKKFEKFLLADYEHPRNRILVFANELCKAILAKPDLTILCDGTFKFCLRPFEQLYTIHVDLGSSKSHTNIIPVIYALLARKTRITYKILFRLIKAQIPEFNPKTIILDFEKAAMMAVKDIFPEINISGCFFHFSRCLWRKAEELGITKSALSRKHVKRCIVLAHLPNNAIENGWLYILSQCPNEENVLKFNDYFVETWLDENSFFANKWSCSNMLHRTTNMVESWHSTINKKINSKPKSIAHILNILQEEDSYYRTLYLQGSNITKTLKKPALLMII